MGNRPFKLHRTPKCTKKCVKTYRQIFKLYKVCHYQLYVVCPYCGCEFDHRRHLCPCCGNSPNNSNPGSFIFFPELQVETSLSQLFPELFFYP